MAGDGAEDRQADPPVEALGGKHEGRSSTGLLVSGLRVEMEPDSISAAGNVVFGYHVSRPSGVPVSTESWRLSSVTLSSNSVNE